MKDMEETKVEIWKDIIGYEGLYQVSNFGRVKSLNYRKTGKEVIKQILELNKEKDKIIVIVTHNTELSKVADRVLKIYDGKIVSDVTNKNPMNIEDIEL